MADDPYYLASLELAAFRAYLVPKTFDFSKKRNLAIFAPNGKGKSSVIDGLEFMFSDDGTLERLGQRAVHNQAGPTALVHNRASKTDINPRVTIGFLKGSAVSNGTRSATGSNRTMPTSAAAVNDCFVVDPIIRGHTLRTFVENRTAQERYTDVATWLQLGPLVDVQKNLRALRTHVKAVAENTDGIQRINAEAERQTARAVTHWDDAAILAYVNTSVIEPLDKTLALLTIDVIDPAYQAIIRRVKLEERQVGLAGLRQLHQAATAIWAQTKNEETREVTISGAIPSFETALASVREAVKVEADERDKAAGATFQALWKAAEPLFTEGAEVPLVCPLCDTQLDKTAAGGPAAIREHIATHLEKLADYATAKQILDDANTAADLAYTQLKATIPALAGLLGDNTPELKETLTKYRVALDAWTTGDAPASDDLVDALRKFVKDLDSSIATIIAKQGDHTYANAKSKIDRLIELNGEYAHALRTQAELEVLSSELTTQAGIISAEIRKKVQVLLDRLQTPMNDIYRRIQGPNAVSIRLELPAEDDTTQQRLSLVIDFADNLLSVQPSGYLSDSQIHSLALALRMAAIKQFNGAAPIIALDDIVTSYDADHRRTVAGLIAEMFNDCQVLLTTHDERFFNYLKDQLPWGDWQFSRIIAIDPTSGPRFADHKVSDDMIEARWDAGESAANEMRQAEEEWLLDVCRDFRVNVIIRSLEKAYSYERSELAAALGSFLKRAGLNPQQIPGVSNRFLVTLQRGEVENFGSHFQDGLYGDGSIGDERARWEEFKAFRAQFVCPKCSRTRFKRPNVLKKPVCAHDRCEEMFEFVVRASGGEAH